jgi:hypothetical protein
MWANDTKVVEHMVHFVDDGKYDTGNYQDQGADLVL